MEASNENPGAGQEGPVGDTAFDGAGGGATPPAPAPAPPAPTPPGVPAEESNTMAEQFRVLEERLGSIEKNTAAPEAPPTNTREEMLRLLAEEGADQYVEPGAEPEYEHEQEGPYQQQQQQQQPQQSHQGLSPEQLVGRLTQVEDLLLAQEEEVRYNSLSQIAGENSEFLTDPAHMKAVTGTVSRFAEKYGEEMLRSDPELVSLAIRAEQAKIAGQSEVSGDAARTAGASLETQAGATGSGDLSPEEDLKRRIFSTVEGSKDAFTGG